MTETPSDPKKSTGLVNVENTVNIGEFGKETDKSLADILRAALYPGAEEFGLLLKDTIGLAGDRIRQKRQQNVALGMSETRQKLDAHQVEMKDITPPDEEELHMVIEGMSLAKTDELRNMWAGMLAKALDPASDITIERPFVTTLESLSDQDVKVIHMIAVIERSFDDLRISQEQFKPNDSKNLTDDEHEESLAVNIRNRDRHDATVAALFEKAESYGIAGSLGKVWSENLFRLGLVELHIEIRGRNDLSGLSNLHRADPQRAVQALGEVFTNMKKLEELKELRPNYFIRKGRFTGAPLEQSVIFTPFGRRFAHACGLFDAPQ